MSRGHSGPGGKFVELAEARIVSLHETETAVAAPTDEVTEGELVFWNSIKDSGSCIELAAYLERYPEGEFVELAAARLETLQQTPAGTGASMPQAKSTRRNQG